MQLWIAKGTEPLPRRVVVTYRNSPGEPQFRADLSDWKVGSKMGAAPFIFVPPPGAERIMYLAPRVSTDAAAGATGEQP